MRTVDILQESFDVLWRSWMLIFVMALEALFVTLLVLAPFLPAIIDLVEAYPDPDLIIQQLEVWADRISSSPLLVAKGLLLITLVGLVASIAHIFFVGGLTRVLHDSSLADRAEKKSPRDQIAALFSGARELFFPTLLVYSITWGVAMVLGLVPALPLIAYLAVEEDTRRLAIFGVIGLLLWIFLLVIIGIATRAVTSVALGRICHDSDDVIGALRSSLSSIRAFPLPFLKLVVATTLVVIGAGFASGSIDLFSGLTGSWLALGIAIEAIAAGLGMTVSAAAGIWFLSAFIIWEHTHPPASPLPSRDLNG